MMCRRRIPEAGENGQEKTAGHSLYCRVGRTCCPAPRREKASKAIAQTALPREAADRTPGSTRLEDLEFLEVQGGDYVKPALPRAVDPVGRIIHAEAAVELVHGRFERCIG